MSEPDQQVDFIDESQYCGNCAHLLDISGFQCQCAIDQEWRSDFEDRSECVYWLDEEDFS